MIETYNVFFLLLGLYQLTFLICNVIQPWKRVMSFAFRRHSAIDQHLHHNCLATPVTSAEREEDVG